VLCCVVYVCAEKMCLHQERDLQITSLFWRALKIQKCAMFAQDFSGIFCTVKFTVFCLFSLSTISVMFIYSTCLEFLVRKWQCYQHNIIYCYHISTIVDNVFLLRPCLVVDVAEECSFKAIDVKVRRWFINYIASYTTFNFSFYKEQYLKCHGYLFILLWLKLCRAWLVLQSMTTCGGSTILIFIQATQAHSAWPSLCG